MAWSKAECNDRLTGKEFTMNSRKRKKKSPINMAWRRGFVCLSLICALQAQPLTILADGSFAQADLTNSAGQAKLTDSAGQTDPADAFSQADPADASRPDITADPSSVSGGIAEDLIGETGGSSTADNAATHKGEGTKDNASEDSGSNTIPNAVPDDALTGDDRITDDAGTEKTEVPTLVGQSAGVSLAPSEYPSKFDLRDLGLVTPVKLQEPWGTCWAFSVTAAAEISILSKMGKTYAETGLDLSERYLAWYVAQPVTEDISTSQAGEGLFMYDENPNHIYLYGGREKCAGTLYAQGIGPVPESEYPYRGQEGNLAYEALLANKDAFIETQMASYRQQDPYSSDAVLKAMAEAEYKYRLSVYAVYDTYSGLDDWTISEADEPGSGRLRGSPYTLIDNNVLIYWVDDDDDGFEEYEKEPLVVVPRGTTDTKRLYQDSIDQIKAELTSGRGISVDIKLGDYTFNEKTWAHYYNGDGGTVPHGVCIVGWDDDYPASNFNTAPPGNGAWIVKNSWGSQTDIIPGGLVAADGTTKDANGSDWGIVDENGLHTGYFYLSYYDDGIGVPECFDFDLRENHDQETALQFDYMPASADEWVHKSDTPMWCANVFNLERDMRIDEVATRFSMDDDVPLTGFTVAFDIYRLNDGASAPDDGELLASCTREFKNFGYHRVALDAPVYSKAGDRLAVVVRQSHNYEDGSVKYIATAQESLDYKSNPLFRRDPLYGKPVINEGESFLKIEGVTEKEEDATGGWLDVCAPFSRDFLWYLTPNLASDDGMAQYYESRTVGKPIKDAYNFDNFGIKAFGEPVTLEYVEAVAATCEEAGSLAYWRDPQSGAIFADESGTKLLSEEDVTVDPLGHAWGKPTYTWNEDNASVTARCICQRDKKHVLEETVKTTVTTDDKTGKITWTAQFENEVFKTQTVSVSTEPVISPSVTAAPTGTVKPTSATPTRKASGTPTGTAKQVSAVPTRGASGNTGVSNSAVKNASATPAAKTSDPSATKSASVSTGDDNDPAFWFTLLTAALTCIAAMFILRRSHRAAGR